MTLNAFRHHTVLLLALLPLAGACSKQASPLDAVRSAEATQRALAALPPECTLGTPGLNAQGTWLNSTKAVPGAGPGIVNVFSFDKAVSTRALRAALNRQALQDIEKAETRDAQGNWSDAGPIIRRDAPAGCEYVWLVQELPDTRQVDALRFTFRQQPGTISVSNPSVLQTSTGR
jgi:hypothetical protein